MELLSLIAALSDPAAYPRATGKIEVHQTHISLVFLAGCYAYKIKKPVKLGFVDFSTLQRREHFCHEEVRLNRRLAPGVYLGVVPVTRDASGWKFEGDGEVVEWAVKMRRLPRESSLESLVEQGTIRVDLIRRLARRLATFYDHTESDNSMSAFGHFETIAQNARENFEQAANQINGVVSRTVFERLRALTEESLQRNRCLIEERAAHGIPCDTHGDLRLEHVYVFAEGATVAGGSPENMLQAVEPYQADEFAIIDCIEFNPRFRFADPVSDIAFLAMDLIFHGRRDLATAFAEEYFRLTNDPKGSELLPFYTAYRATVRAKVEGIELQQVEFRDGERAALAKAAHAHWLLALGELESSNRRPCLVLIGGLPGSGKTTLAKSLAEKMNLQVIRSDLVRKHLAGISSSSPAKASFGNGIYSEDWSDKTYAECLRQTESLLLEGRRVAVDASFMLDQRRRGFLDLASSLAVPAVFIHCQAAPDTIQRRLGDRGADASDADWTIYEKAVDHWETFSPATRPFVSTLQNAGTFDKVVSRAMDAMSQQFIA